MANEGVDILGLPQTVGGLTGDEWIPLVQGGTTKRTQASNIVQSGFTNLFLAGFDYEINGNNSVIATGVAGSGIIVPFDCTLTGCIVEGVGTGSVVIDIWRTTTALFNGGVTHPAVGDSICGTNKPTITAGSIVVDSALSTWTISLNQNDILWFKVDSVATFTSVTVALQARRLVQP